MRGEIRVASMLTAALLALVGCDADATPTQIGAPDGGALEVMPMFDRRDEPRTWLIVASPAQEVTVEVEGAKPFQALSELEFRVASDGTARGRGRLLATNPTAVEYAVLLVLEDDRVLRFEGAGVAQDFPRGQKQAVRITGSIRIPGTGTQPGGIFGPHTGGIFIAVGDVNADPEGSPPLTWSIQARVILMGDPEAQPARPAADDLGR